MTGVDPGARFVEWFRGSAPYIHAFRGQTFVLTFGGELLANGRFTGVAHDIALLNSLGIRLVIVHGTRPRIEERLRVIGAENRYLHGMRVTDEQSMVAVKEAAGAAAIDIASGLSMGLANTPMAGARIRVTSGNFVTARPLGIIDGVDYGYTGAVRRIDHEAIRQQLEAGAIVLLSPIGYSPTGEAFNLGAQAVAAATAGALGARKYICLADGPGPKDGSGELVRELSLAEAERRLADPAKLGETQREELGHAVDACRAGVRRAHLLDYHIDGALLLELFTRDGIGTMVSIDLYQGTRRASIEDIGGILGLIAPLEEGGALVRRSREHLELEIDRFTVIERDGTVIACAALRPFPDEKVAELACLAVHPDYRRAGHGDALLERADAEARRAGIDRLFVLTTRAAHWFLERGFHPAEIDDLPVARRALYNYQRNSRVFIRDVRSRK